MKDKARLERAIELQQLAAEHSELARHHLFNLIEFNYRFTNGPQKFLTGAIANVNYEQKMARTFYYVSRFLVIGRE